MSEVRRLLSEALEGASIFQIQVPEKTPIATIQQFVLNTVEP